MAITLGDLVDRLAGIDLDLEEANYGNAHRRVNALINIIENGGVIIHAVAKTENKKVESNGNNEEE